MNTGFAAPALRPDRRLRTMGIALRPAVDADMPFLRRLYADLRADELVIAPWTDAAKAAFIESQFALQHHHFTTPGIATDRWIVARGGRAVGRLYANRGDSPWRLVEIGLTPAAQGQGVGSALLDWLKREARDAGARGIDLHVHLTNPRAAALYARHGFVATDADSATHRRMIWHVRPVRQLKTA